MRFRCIAAVCAAVLVLPVALSLPALAGPQDKEPPPGVVARVNGRDITQSVLLWVMSKKQMEFARQGIRFNREQIQAMRDQVLDLLISEELIYQASRKQGIKVDKMAIRERFLEIRDRFPSEVEFQRWLEKQDLTDKEFIEEMERTEAIHLYLKSHFLKEATPTEAEIKKYYHEHKDDFTNPERVRARHILVAVDEDASEKEREIAKNKLSMVQKKLTLGEDFGELARQYSDCPSSKNGGELGFFTRGVMVEPFEEKAFSMEPGQVEGPVKTRFGYHIIELEEKAPASAKPLEEVRKAIAEGLLGLKTAKLTRELVDRLEAEAEIQIYLPDYKKRSVETESAPKETP